MNFRWKKRRRVWTKSPWRRFGRLILFLKFDKVLAINIDKPVENNEIEIPDEIKSLIEQRKVARENKDWALSDKIRDELKEKGYIVKDTKNGMEIEKI